MVIDKFKQYLVYTIILTFPVMSIVDYFGMFKFNTALSDIFVILLSILYFIDIRRFDLKKNFPYWWWFLHLLCIAILSNIFALYNPVIESNSVIGIVNEGIKIIIIASYYFVGYNSQKNNESLKKTIIFWIAGLWIFIVVGLYSTISTWMGIEIIKWHNTLGNDSRLLGTLTDANAAALYLSISFFIVLFYNRTLMSTKIEKIYSFITMVMTVLCIVFTFSRGGLIGFSIGFIFYLFCNIKRLYKKVLLIIPLLIVLGLLVINIDTNYFNSYFYSTFVGRSQDVLEGTGMFETRKALSLSALYMGLEHPILGVGRGNFSLNSKPYLISQGIDWNTQGDFYKDLIPHNTLAGIFAEMGIVGLLVFISLFCIMFYKLYKAKSISKSIKILLYSLWISIFVQSLAINLENTRALWIIVGMLFSILNYKIDLEDDLLFNTKTRWSKTKIFLAIASTIVCLGISYSLFVDTAVKLKGDAIDISNKTVKLLYEPTEQGTHILRYYVNTKNINNNESMKLKIYNNDLKDGLLNSVEYDEAIGYGNMEFDVNENMNEISVELIGQNSTKIKDIKVITPTNKIIPILNDYSWLSDSLFYKYQREYKLVDEETQKKVKDKRRIFKNGTQPTEEQVILGDKVVYKGTKITKLENNKVKFDFTFECLEKMEWDYVFWMHIHVDDINTIPKELLKHGYINADHDLEIPTTSWEPGETYVHTYIRELLPGEYNVNFGFWLWEQLASDGKTHRLCTNDGKNGINLGWFSVDVEN